MNAAHARLCSSAEWARHVAVNLVPFALRDVSLGDDVLEVGPGYGATTVVLASEGRTVTALERDGALAERLRRALPCVRIVHGDGTRMPFGDDTFTAVVCFTMLHHVSTRDAQRALLREGYRVVRAGGILAGSDSRDGAGFRALHRGDTCLPVVAGDLRRWLTAFGCHDVEVTTRPRTIRFLARKPERSTP